MNSEILVAKVPPGFAYVLLMPALFTPYYTGLISILCTSLLPISGLEKERCEREDDAESILLPSFCRSQRRGNKSDT